LFSDLIDAFEGKQQMSSMLDIASFLVMPVQRMPRYELLLRELIKYTGEEHPDHTLLLKAEARVKHILEVLNKGIDAQTRSQTRKLLAIDEKISFPKHFETVYSADRKYVKEGMCYVILPSKKKKQCYLFMFNDLLVGCVSKSSKSNTSSEAIHPYFMNDETGKIFDFLFALNFSEITNVKFGDQVIKSKSFVLMVGENNDEYCFCTKSKEEKLEWENALSNEIQFPQRKWAQQYEKKKLQSPENT